MIHVTWPTYHNPLDNVGLATISPRVAQAGDPYVVTKNCSNTRREDKDERRLTSITRRI